MNVIDCSTLETLMENREPIELINVQPKNEFAAMRIPGARQVFSQAQLQGSNDIQRQRVNGGNESMSLKIRSPLSEILPLWFAILSPLIGLVFGLAAAWAVLSEVLPFSFVILSSLGGLVFGLVTARMVGR